jgi:hypothetical protein
MDFRPTDTGVFVDVVISYAAAIGVIGGDVVKLVSWMRGFGVMPAVINRTMLQGRLSSRIVTRLRRAPISPGVIVRIVRRIGLGSLFVHDEPVRHTRN